ncbi:hypothetical protein BT69DRAFT_1296799 [Atractiella rhizophila]|nr:hypothetical protein BT69DRAFT_1296799 [Atractiella rhizophila]
MAHWLTDEWLETEAKGSVKDSELLKILKSLPMEEREKILQVWLASLPLSQTEDDTSLTTPSPSSAHRLPSSQVQPTSSPGLNNVDIKPKIVYDLDTNYEKEEEERSFARTCVEEECGYSGCDGELVVKLFGPPSFARPVEQAPAPSQLASFIAYLSLLANRSLADAPMPDFGLKIKKELMPLSHRYTPYPKPLTSASSLPSSSSSSSGILSPLVEKKRKRDDGPTIKDRLNVLEMKLDKIMTVLEGRVQKSGTQAQTKDKLSIIYSLFNTKVRKAIVPNHGARRNEAATWKALMLNGLDNSERVMWPYCRFNDTDGLIKGLRDSMEVDSVVEGLCDASMSDLVGQAQSLATRKIPDHLPPHISSQDPRAALQTDYSVYSGFDGYLMGKGADWSSFQATGDTRYLGNKFLKPKWPGYLPSTEDGSVGFRIDLRGLNDINGKAAEPAAELQGVHKGLSGSLKESDLISHPYLDDQDVSTTSLHNTAPLWRRYPLLCSSHGFGKPCSLFDWALLKEYTSYFPNLNDTHSLFQLCEDYFGRTILDWSVEEQTANWYGAVLLKKYKKICPTCNEKLIMAKLESGHKIDEEWLSSGLYFILPIGAHNHPPSPPMKTGTEQTDFILRCMELVLQSEERLSGGKLLNSRIINNSLGTGSIAAVAPALINLNKLRKMVQRGKHLIQPLTIPRGPSRTSDDWMEEIRHMWKEEQLQKDPRRLFIRDVQQDPVDGFRYCVCFTSFQAETLLHVELLAIDVTFKGVERSTNLREWEVAGMYHASR